MNKLVNENVYLRARSQSRINEIYHRICLFLVFFGRMDAVLYENDICFMILIAMSVFGMILLAFQKPNQKYSFSFAKWQVVFVLYCAATYFWSFDQSVTLTNWIALAGRAFLLCYIWMYLIRTDNLKRLLEYFVSSTVLVIFHIAAANGIGSLFAFREVIEVGSGWNANSVGMNAAFAVFYVILLNRNLKSGSNNKNKMKKSLIYYLHMLLLLLFVACIIGSGSKKALLLLFGFVSHYLFLKRKNKITIGILILFIFSISYYLIINVNYLYSVVGERFETLISGMLFNNIDLMSISDRTRMNLVNMGWEFVAEKPWFGYGLANFKALINSRLYSHNNYIELLVGGGIVALTIYYSSYIYVIVKAIRNKKEIGSIVAISLLIPLVIIEYGLVSYLDFEEQIIIVFVLYLAQNWHTHGVNTCQL